MKGIVKTFLQENGYGFIAGEDGKDYYFKASVACDGDLFEFDPIATPKGYRARNLKALKQTFSLPDDVIVSKNKSVRSYKLIELSDWIVIAKASDDSNIPIEKLKKYAKALGANALLNLSYAKETGSEGNYRFTIHVRAARLAYVAKPSLRGDWSEDEHKSINELAQKAKQKLNAIKHKRLCLLVIALVILSLTNLRLFFSNIGIVAVIFLIASAIVLIAGFKSALAYGEYLQKR